MQADSKHKTEERMRGECYVRLLSRPEKPSTMSLPEASKIAQDTKTEEKHHADLQRCDKVVASFVRHNRYKEMQALIQQDTGVLESVDEHKNSLLHIACQNNNGRICKLLLQSGISVNIQNSRGNTPLHYCHLYGFEQLADYLIANGADDSVPNSAGFLPLQGIGTSEEPIVGAQRRLQLAKAGGGSS
eukprot:gnl/TRDRNA2_/TRDRNA2_72048_c1_seq1.p1 gnl/TRDRNA2_/TRDRNA2_72048_c1~~gnl/TRDRNA2_/TRDRNA2_72048_c1_seq1.p1  ORF type:complete len:210 (+),score=29.31 gnl/TRDRNA2_/TRDRNA2_72048_c1_seq1:69-632(+)